MSRKQRFLVVCSAHARGESLKNTKILEGDLQRIYRQHFGSDTSITLIWNVIPEGQAFIAGAPSTATTVLTPVPDHAGQDLRERFMRDICTSWQGRTGCSINEIIVTAMNVTEAKRYAQMSRRRFDPRKGKSLAVKVGVGMLHSRATKGYLSNTLNMPS
ncbi:hypothetical protein [Mycobacterium spongiae]|uniref:Uncharacterized protein n=1 Tax=Mycobacterium spongiae TaxID=886343 RepID=A0A975JVW7_9MYCO|nr:hypothetical protein [Mycobacterium spongiae]QUR66094.1 hypothetical protein F6B93_02455 [Mycobacterium spongiae]